MKKQRKKLSKKAVVKAADTYLINFINFCNNILTAQFVQAYDLLEKRGA